MNNRDKSALALALAIVGGIAAGMRCDASEWVENSSQTNPRPAAYTVKAYTDPFDAMTKSDSPTLTCGDITLDINGRAGRRGTRAFDLTRLEFRMLRCLMERHGGVVKTAELARELWPNSGGRGIGALHTRLHSLRQKLTDGGAPDPIRSVKGLGYVFNG